MTDRTTGMRIQVSTYGTASSSIRVPHNQLEEIKRILDKNNIPYQVRENIISMSGGPFIAVVDLGRGVDANRVQTILDSGS